MRSEFTSTNRARAGERGIPGQSRNPFVIGLEPAAQYDRTTQRSHSVNRILFPVELDAPNRRAYFVWRADFPAVATPRADLPMNKPAPRRPRGASTRNRLLRRTTPPECPNQEGLTMTATATEPGIRADLVARVRREILAGVYDTPAKFAAALGRLAARCS